MGNTTDDEHGRLAIRFCGDDITWDKKKKFGGMPSLNFEIEHGQPLTNIFLCPWDKPIETDMKTS